MKAIRPSDIGNPSNLTTVAKNIVGAINEVNDRTVSTIQTIVTLTGDVSGSGASSITTTLANSGVAAGSYRQVKVDAKGRVISGNNDMTLAEVLSYFSL